MTKEEFHLFIAEVLDYDRAQLEDEMYEKGAMSPKNDLYSSYAKRLQAFEDAIRYNKNQMMDARMESVKMRRGGYIDLSQKKPDMLMEKQQIPEVDVVKVANFEYEGPKAIKSYDDAETVLRQFMVKEKIITQEQFLCIYLNQANEIQYIYFHSQGTQNATQVDKTMVVAIGVKLMCKGVVLAHNHPSGSLKPSQADIQTTKDLKKAFGYFGITVLDHIILTKESYYSFANTGMLKQGGKIDDMVMDDVVEMGEGGETLTVEQQVQLMSNYDVIEALDQYYYYDRMDAGMDMEQAYPDDYENRERLIKAMKEAEGRKAEKGMKVPKRKQPSLF